METSLLPHYVLDDTLDNDTPNGDNGINNNDNYENYINDNNGNNDRNDHDNDKNHDNDNGDQKIMTFQAMDFGEHFVCEKLNFAKVHRS